MSTTPTDAPRPADRRSAALLGANPAGGGMVRLALRRRLRLRGGEGLRWKWRAALWSLALYLALVLLFVALGKAIFLT